MGGFFGGGGGGTGGGPYTVITTTSTLESQKSYMVDTSSSAYTVTLPATPANGDYVEIFDRANSFGTNNLTIDRNGNKIESLTENLTCNVNGAAFKLAYANSTTGWQVIPFYGFAGPNFVGATSSTAGTAVLVPQPAAGKEAEYLRGDATFQPATAEFIPTTRKAASGKLLSYVWDNASVGAKALANGFIVWGFSYIAKTKSYSTVGIEVTSSAASTAIKVGLYTINTSGLADSLIFETGEISSTTTGIKTISITPVTITAGWYLSAFRSNGAPAVRGINGRNIYASTRDFGTGTSWDYSSSTYSNALPSSWTDAMVTGSIFNPNAEIY